MTATLPELQPLTDPDLTPEEHALIANAALAESRRLIKKARECAITAMAHLDSTATRDRHFRVSGTVTSLDDAKDGLR